MFWEDDEVINKMVFSQMRSLDLSLKNTNNQNIVEPIKIIEKSQPIKSMITPITLPTNPPMNSTYYSQPPVQSIKTFLPFQFNKDLDKIPINPDLSHISDEIKQEKMLNYIL